MKIMGMSYRIPLGFALTFLCLTVTPTTFAAKKSYIVYLGGHSRATTTAAADTQEIVTNSHHQLLGSLFGGIEKAKESIFYSYINHINGFAAILEEDEALQLSKHPGVVSVFPNRGHYLHTTHSWEFLGLDQGSQALPNSLWKKGKYGEDVIIGHIDSGVWPESKSFSDEGFGPVPARWKGVCQNNTDVNGVKCNRKLIGARYYEKGYVHAVGAPDRTGYTSPRDHQGHGTHTLSTAAGNFVHDASIFGLANGTAKGGSPRARVATYKVCWAATVLGECFDADLLAAFDAAISDGVDVITLSIGGGPADYVGDAIAIGSFHAVSRGIVVVSSAGNGGPTVGSVSNVAPWLLTVAASTLDRKFFSYLSLGNNKTLKGPSLSSSSLEKKLYPLATGSAVKAADANPDEASYCIEGTLDPNKARGKIIACLTTEIDSNILKGHTVQEVGGVGMILCNDQTEGNFVIPEAHLLPAAHLSFIDSKEVFAYVNSTKSPIAYIGPPITELRTTPSPVMALFSSQGPNTITPEILKPDITAPGVMVLAAFSPEISPTGFDFDSRHLNFNLLSGTSMACPHVSGIVGLIKNAHPDWSPAAIKSAIMTTARKRNNLKEPITDAAQAKATPHNYGSGHLHAGRAMDPGLVYDISMRDYFNFLCAIGYNKSTIFSVAGESYSCPAHVPTVVDLNYPSITIPNINGTEIVSRTVKNVGKPGTYTVHVQPPPGIVVSVKPQSLKFERVGEEKIFTVTVEADKGSHKGYVFGWLYWSDGMHYVRSPISVGFSSS